VLTYKDIVELELEFKRTFGTNIWDYYNKVTGFSRCSLEYDLVYKPEVKGFIRLILDNQELVTKVLDYVEKEDVKDKIEGVYGKGSYDLIIKAYLLKGAYFLIQELGTEVEDSHYLTRYIENRAYGINPVLPLRSKAVIVGNLAWEESTKLIIHIPSGLPLRDRTYSKNEAKGIMENCLAIPGLSLKQPDLQCLTKLIGE
jgi:hypothetical protein